MPESAHSIIIVIYSYSFVSLPLKNALEEFIQLIWRQNSLRKRNEKKLWMRETHWQVKWYVEQVIMISKAGGRSMQDPERAELPRRRAQAVVSPHGVCTRLCLCECLYDQWNYFLLTTASSLTTNNNFDKLASPWRQQDSTTTVSMVQELFSTLRKFPLRNKSWSKWHRQVMQNARVEPARWFPSRDLT